MPLATITSSSTSKRRMSEISPCPSFAPGSPPDRVVFDPARPQDARFVQVAAVEDDGLLQRGGDRVEFADARTRRKERIDDRAAGRFAHVVGVGLDSQTPEREPAPFEPFPE